MINKEFNIVILLRVFLAMSVICCNEECAVFLNRSQFNCYENIQKNKINKIMFNYAIKMNASGFLHNIHISIAVCFIFSYRVNCVDDGSANCGLASKNISLDDLFITNMYSCYVSISMCNVLWDWDKFRNN